MRIGARYVSDTDDGANSTPFRDTDTTAPVGAAIGGAWQLTELGEIHVAGTDQEDSGAPNRHRRLLCEARGNAEGTKPEPVMVTVTLPDMSTRLGVTASMAGCTKKANCTPRLPAWKSSQLMETSTMATPAQCGGVAHAAAVADIARSRDVKAGVEEDEDAPLALGPRNQQQARRVTVDDAFTKKLAP